MANTIDDLRSHLFETLAALKDKDAPMDLDRAQAVAEVAKVIVESAKVEVSFLKVTGALKSTGFLPEADKPAAAVGRRLANAAPPGDAGPAGEHCVLCGIRLTTPYLIERGVCGSCSERPEAQQHAKPSAVGRVDPLRKRA
jgi:hypothetical protein